MRKTRLILLGGLGLLAILVAVLAGRNRQPPVLPSDEIHETWHGPQECLECHGPQDALRQGPNHPIGNDCLRCHGSR